MATLKKKLSLPCEASTQNSKECHSCEASSGRSWFLGFWLQCWVIRLRIEELLRAAQRSGQEPKYGICAKSLVK